MNKRIQVNTTCSQKQRLMEELEKIKDKLKVEWQGSSVISVNEYDYESLKLSLDWLGITFKECPENNVFLVFEVKELYEFVDENDTGCHPLDTTLRGVFSTYEKADACKKEVEANKDANTLYVEIEEHEVE